MVGRGHHHGVDGGVVQKPPVVLHQPWFLSICLLDRSGHLLQNRVVHVADSGDMDVIPEEKVSQMPAPHAAGPDEAHGYLVVQGCPGGFQGRRRKRAGSCGSGQGGEEFSSSYGFHVEFLSGCEIQRSTGTNGQCIHAGMPRRDERRSGSFSCGRYQTSTPDACSRARCTARSCSGVKNSTPLPSWMAPARSSTSGR